jgi:hypothetical protein
MSTDSFNNHEVVASRYCQDYWIPGLEILGGLKLEVLKELDKLGDDRIDTCQNFEKRFLIKIKGQREHKRHETYRSDVSALDSAF